jgi:hypothetical protein
VFVSFTPLLSLYKKDCGSLKASWAKKTMLFFEPTCNERWDPTGSFQSHARGIAPQIDTSPEDEFDISTAPEGRW